VGGGGTWGGIRSNSGYITFTILYHTTKAPLLGGKRKLFWVGSSHALRLYQAALRNVDIKNRFENDAHVKPGATFSQLHILSNRLKSLNEQDVVIFQLFGNDLFEKHIKIDRVPRKIIHLTKFRPTSEPVLRDRFLALKALLNELRCKIIVIDNPFRHLICCEKHRYSGLIRHVKQANSLVGKTLTGYLVLDHNKLLGVSTNRLKRPTEYQVLLSDSVHFYSRYYDAIVVNVVERFIDTGIPPVYLT
jgi:hypothetical protein